MADYEEMHAAQRGKCALCARTKPLHVDHEHDEGGRVRGLLCYSCNVSLGQLGDTADALKRVVNYLEG